MRRTLLALVFVAGCAQAPQVIERVVVRDPEFQVLRTIEDPEGLAKFAGLWRSRQQTDSGPRRLSEYPFKLDIAANQGSGRWLYRRDGFTTLLSAKSGNVYAIQDANSLNAILGIAKAPVANSNP